MTEVNPREFRTRGWVAIDVVEEGWMMAIALLTLHMGRSVTTGRPYSEDRLTLRSVRGCREHNRTIKYRPFARTSKITRVVEKVNKVE